MSGLRLELGLSSDNKDEVEFGSISGRCKAVSDNVVRLVARNCVNCRHSALAAQMRPSGSETGGIRFSGLLVLLVCMY